LIIAALSDMAVNGRADSTRISASIPI